MFLKQVYTEFEFVPQVVFARKAKSQIFYEMHDRKKLAREKNRREKGDQSFSMTVILP